MLCLFRFCVFSLFTKIDDFVCSALSAAVTPLTTSELLLTVLEDGVDDRAGDRGTIGT